MGLFTYITDMIARKIPYLTATTLTTIIFDREKMINDSFIRLTKNDQVVSICMIAITWLTKKSVTLCG